MARDLRGAADRAGLLAGQQHMRPPLMDPTPSRPGDLLVDGVTQ